MKLVLQNADREEVISRELKTNEDFTFIGDASVLVYKGQYYGFERVDSRNGLSNAKAVFRVCNEPLNIDSFMS